MDKPHIAIIKYLLASCFIHQTFVAFLFCMVDYCVTGAEDIYTVFESFLTVCVNKCKQTDLGPVCQKLPSTVDSHDEIGSVKCNVNNIFKLLLVFVLVAIYNLSVENVFDNYVVLNNFCSVFQVIYITCEWKCPS